MICTDRREQIREEMVENFKTGGARAKYLWIRRWFGTGEGQIGYLKYLGFALTGFQGLAANDFTSLILFGIAYVFASIGVGFLYYWFHFTAIDQFIANILNPFVHDMRDAVLKGDKDG